MRTDKDPNPLISIRPLSSRVEDIPLLADYFLNNICKNYNIKPFEIKDNNYLLNYNWPGNVRELRNLIERVAILSRGTDQNQIMDIIKEASRTEDWKKSILEYKKLMTRKNSTMEHFNK